MKNWVEISGARLVENFRATRAAAGPDVETLAVIKADGYGHGATICASVLAKAGARWLGVTDAEEGAKVREALGEGGTRIMVMSGVELGDAAALISHGLTPVVWTAWSMCRRWRRQRVRRDSASAYMSEVDKSRE